jgi:flagellar FliL protein
MAAIDIAQQEEPEETEQKPKRSGGGRTVILIAVIVVVLLGGGGAGVYLFYPGLLGALTGAQADAGAKKGARAKEVKPKEPPIYVELGDAFVVNFSDGNRTRYLQVRIEAMTRDQTIAAAINTHLPRIRNNLVFLLSAVDNQTISTVAGKERLRDEALKEVQDVLRDEIGKPGVEAVYFTSLVVQ